VPASLLRASLIRAITNIRRLPYRQNPSAGGVMNNPGYRMQLQLVTDPLFLRVKLRPLML
jgi:hypothetical protein